MIRHSIPLAIALFAGSTAAAYADPVLTVDLRGLFMMRSNGSSEPLVSTVASPGTGNVFKSSQFEPDFTPGAKGRIAVTNGAYGVEAGAFWLDQATEDRVFTGSTNLIIETNPTTSYGFGAGDTLSAHDASDIIGANFYGTWAPYDDESWTVYFGPRFIQLKERFNIFGDFGGGDFEDDSWHTNNRLMGAELGVRADLFKLFDFDGDGWSLNGDVGVGVFGNSARTNFNVADPGVPSRIFTSTSASDTSAAADLGLNLSYPVTDYADVSLGYDLLYLSNVETATGQVPATGSFNVLTVPMGSHFESVFYNGFEFGFSLHT